MSTRENIHSGHVETLKVERFGMREGRKRERLEVRRPPACFGLFLCTLTTCVSFCISLRPALLFVFLVPLCPELAVLPLCRLDFFTCWFCMAPKGFTTRYAGAKGAYCDGQCLIVRLRTFPGRVRTTVNISEAFLGNGGANCAC